MGPWALAWLLWAAATAPPGPVAPPLAAAPVAQQEAPERLADLPVRRLAPGQRRVRERQRAPEAVGDGEDERVAVPPLQRFAVRIVAPSGRQPVAGKVRVVAEVEADRPAAVKGVEFLIDGRPVFVDADPPYELWWDAGRPASHRLEVRAYGPGQQQVSAVLETPGPGSGPAARAAYAARVERVEVYVRVEGPGGRTPDLPAEAFEVYEDGVRQPIVAVERVTDLPVAVGLLVDCSGSMVERLQQALVAARAFVEGLLTQPQDKAFVMSFADLPILLRGFTNDVAGLEAALGLVSRGRYTALYDAVIAAAGEFAGIDARRALVVLTDGHDRGSGGDLRQAIDAAQRADVALYPVGVDLPPRFFRERWVLRRMAEATGGRVWFMEPRDDPAGIYGAIAADLRAQYRVAYRPLIPGGGGEWRAIEVRIRGVEGPLRVRARPGYYAE